jgi:acetyl-CoA carboxylase carboxyl transferase subunit beta
MAFVKRKKADGQGKPSKSIPDGLWIKCAGCGQTVFRNEVEENLQVCPACGLHFRISAQARVACTVDPDSFQETHAGLRTRDPLHFRVGGEAYADRVARAREETGLEEALLTGFARIEGTRVALGVMDARFMMASMGSVVGEKFCRLAEDAIREGAPMVLFVASGGARMQEGILGLMQMAKTATAVYAMNEAGLPYLVVLTDPTSGGVWASLASLGDITLAEPGAYIGFAGTRLIEGALKIKTPEGFQRAEYQFENGFVDQVVPRRDLRPLLARLVRYLSKSAEPRGGVEPVVK